MIKTVLISLTGVGAWFLVLYFLIKGGDKALTIHVDGREVSLTHFQSYKNVMTATVKGDLLEFAPRKRSQPKGHVVVVYSINGQTVGDLYLRKM